MDETNWKPTEEELVSLGFENNSKGVFILSFEDEYFDNACIWYSIGGAFGISVNSKPERPNDWFVNPKSLEELKTLISMMRP